MEKKLLCKKQKKLTGLPSQGSLCFLVWQQCPRAPTETAKCPNIVSPVNLNTASGCFASFYSIQTQQLTCISLYRSDVLCIQKFMNKSGLLVLFCTWTVWRHYFNLWQRRNPQIFTLTHRVVLTKNFSDVYNYIRIWCQEARRRHHTILHPFFSLLIECNSREGHEIDSWEDRRPHITVQM